MNEYTNEQLFDDLKRWLDAPKVSLMNPQRVNSLRELERDITALFESEEIDANIWINDSAYQNGDIVLNIEANEFIVRDTKLISRLIMELDNFEMYITEPGKIHFSGIFPGVFYVGVLPEE